MASFVAGVNVVSSTHAGFVHGVTAIAFAGLSIEPPRVLVCISKRSRVSRFLHRTGVLGISMLSEEQRSLAERYARPGRAPLAIAESELQLEAEAPAVPGAMAFLGCRVAERHDGSTHTVFIADVGHVRVDQDKRPLAYFRGAYRRLEL